MRHLCSKIYIFFSCLSQGLSGVRKYKSIWFVLVLWVDSDGWAPNISSVLFCILCRAAEQDEIWYWIQNVRPTFIARPIDRQSSSVYWTLSNHSQVNRKRETEKTEPLPYRPPIALFNGRDSFHFDYLIGRLCCHGSQLDLAPSKRGSIHVAACWSGLGLKRKQCVYVCACMRKLPDTVKGCGPDHSIEQ